MKKSKEQERLEMEHELDVRRIKRERRSKIIQVGIFILIAISVIISLYSLWIQSTERMSAQFDCTLSGMKYDVQPTNQTCLLPFEYGNLGEQVVCGLPQEIHCSGSVEGFSLLRAIVEGSRRKW